MKRSLKSALTSSSRAFFLGGGGGGQRGAVCFSFACLIDFVCVYIYK